MSEPKMVDKKPRWTTSKEEVDKLVDELSEVCYEYGKDESNPKMLNVFYATKALKNYVGIMQGRIELLNARIAELKLLIDDLTNIRNINDIDEKWWDFVDSAREELMR